MTWCEFRPQKQPREICPELWENGGGNAYHQTFVHRTEQGLLAMIEHYVTLSGEYDESVIGSWAFFRPDTKRFMPWEGSKLIVQKDVLEIDCFYPMGLEDSRFTAYIADDLVLKVDHNIYFDLRRMLREMPDEKYLDEYVSVNRSILAPAEFWDLLKGYNWLAHQSDVEQGLTRRDKRLKKLMSEEPRISVSKRNLRP